MRIEQVDVRLIPMLAGKHEMPTAENTLGVFARNFSDAIPALYLIAHLDRSNIGNTKVCCLARTPHHSSRACL